jgi:hypothetical protein
VSSNTVLVYSATSTGSFATDFDGSGIFQTLVTGVVTDTTGFAYTVDGGFGDAWSTGLVAATTASTGAGSIILTTSTSAFGKARLNVTRASTGTTAVKVHLGAF